MTSGEYAFGLPTVKQLTSKSPITISKLEIFFCVFKQKKISLTYLSSLSGPGETLWLSKTDFPPFIQEYS